VQGRDSGKEPELAMKTPIGRRLSESRLPLTLASMVAVAALMADGLLIHFSGPRLSPMWRCVPAVIATMLYARLAGWDLLSLGLTIRPLQGWLYWCKATAVIALAMGVLVSLGVLMCRLAGWHLASHSIPLTEVGDSFVWMCIQAPLIEEPIYRLVVCVPCVVLLRPAGCIIACGLLFSLLHAFYGNPSPDNAVAGFFLVWAFLRSGTILLPLALHSLGNLCVLILSVLITNGWLEPLA